jgi:hypothetical protein
LNHLGPTQIHTGHSQTIIFIAKTARTTPPQLETNSKNFQIPTDSHNPDQALALSSAARKKLKSQSSAADYYLREQTTEFSYAFNHFLLASRC